MNPEEYTVDREKTEAALRRMVEAVDEKEWQEMRSLMRRATADDLEDVARKLEDRDARRLVLAFLSLKDPERAARLAEELL